MHIEDQVCSLELAKKLLTLKIKQNSLFYWVRAETSKDIDVFGLTYMANLFQENNKFKEIYSAFSVAELGEMLPYFLQADTGAGSDSHLEIVKDTNNSWLLAYVVHEHMPPRICILGDTEADARATMLIYLLENGLIKNECL